MGLFMFARDVSHQTSHQKLDQHILRYVSKFQRSEHDS